MLRLPCAGFVCDFFVLAVTTAEKMVIENRHILWRGSHFNLSGSKDPSRRSFWLSSAASRSSDSNSSLSSDDEEFYNRLEDESESSFHRRRKRSGTWP